MSESVQEMSQRGAPWSSNTSRCCGGSPAGAGCRPKTGATPSRSPGCAAWSIDQLTDAGRLNNWLVAICRRECIRLATRARREVPLDAPNITRLVDDGHEAGDLCAETALRDQRNRLYLAIMALPGRQRTVLVELLRQEDQSYLDLSRRLGLPVGSIGPTRQRAFSRLRLDPRIADLSSEISDGHPQVRSA